MSRSDEEKIHGKMMRFRGMCVANGFAGRQIPPMRLPCLTVLLVVSSLSPALASSSGWIETEGGRVRLTTAGSPNAEGKLQGALEIALKPGWKTYWRDPGDAGIPPSLDVSDSINVSGAEIDFPPPKRFDDGYSVWAGYDQPVSLPVTFTIGRPDRFAAIDATVFLGICETICIPVQGELSLDPGSDPDNAEDMALVKAAFAALPSPARADFGVTEWRREADGDLIVEAEIPAGATGDQLFLSGDGGFGFGTPERIEQDGKLAYKAPVIRWPEKTDASIGYVLVTDQGSVSGSLPPS